MISGRRDVANQRAGPKMLGLKCPLCGSDATEGFLEAPDRFHWRREVYRLARCRSCACVWQARPPIAEEMGFHYSEDYHRAVRTGGETGADVRWRRHRELISRYKNGGAILDIGCSSGAFLRTIRSDSWKLYGIELESSTAERARVATGAEIFVGDVMEAPFAPGTFDAITSFDVLEHVYDPKAFLSRVFEWLKPGGNYFVAVPNIASWEARTFGSYWYGLELPRHIFHFSPGSLRQLANSIGFQEVCLKTAPVSYADLSMGYLFSAYSERLGMEATPLSRPTQTNILWRLLGKASRVIFMQPMAAVASLAGAASSIEGIFAKPLTGS